MWFPDWFFDRLEDRLNLAVFDLNEKHRMNDAFVNSHLPPIVYANKTAIVPTDEKPRMSNITGIQPGMFEAKMAQMQKKLTDRLTAGLTKIDGAAEAGAVKMETAVDGVVAKIDKEIDDKLQEFATLTNGGPA